MFFEELLKKLKDKEAINREYGHHSQPLLAHALHYDNSDAVQLLLTYGADCTIQDKENNGVMHRKQRFFGPTSLRGISLLLAHGADPNLKNRGGEGETPLDHAVDDYSFGIVKRFLLSPSKIPLSTDTVSNALKIAQKQDQNPDHVSFYITKMLEKEIKIRSKNELLKTPVFLQALSATLSESKETSLSAQLINWTWLFVLDHYVTPMERIEYSNLLTQKYDAAMKKNEITARELQCGFSFGWGSINNLDSYQYE